MSNLPKYLAFDLETSRVIPEGEQDWSKFRSLGISCAAGLTSAGEMTLWYGKTPEGGYASQMSAEEAQALVNYLNSAAESGYKILTWNGLGFDFDILAQESNMLPVCRNLALEHIDMMFHVFCLKGYPLGLDKAAKGMGLKGKPFGMSGEMAPRLWRDGKYQEVLDYAQQDVRTTLELAEAVDKQHQLKWLSNRGKPQRLMIPSKWLTAQEAMQLPLPDTSWMSNPWPRSKFMKWMES